MHLVLTIKGKPASCPRLKQERMCPADDRGLSVPGAQQRRSLLGSVRSAWKRAERICACLVVSDSLRPHGW